MPDNKVKIDKHIPMPSQYRGVGAEAKYPWASMRIGDSFKYEATITTIPKACGMMNQRHKPKKFSWRNMGNHLRVWRIK